MFVQVAEVWLSAVTLKASDLRAGVLNVTCTCQARWISGRPDTLGQGAGRPGSASRIQVSRVLAES
jgi:hypothetical protein